MKRRVTIIGAGQAGLQLGIGLLKSGHDVTIYNDKTPEEIYEGRVTSSQGMFSTALSYERELGLNYWDEIAPKNEKVSFAICNPELHRKEISWMGTTSASYQSIDQRIKFPKWINTFISLQGNFALKKVDISEVDRISVDSDLTIIASGKGSVGNLFKTSIKHQVFDKPARQLALLYVKNTLKEKKLGVRANILPGIGEFFMMPGLTHSGHCEMMLFEGVPGGPFDGWKGMTSPEALLEHAQLLLNKFLPWEAERCKQAELTDSKATLTGGYTPTIRNPIAKLPSGNLVLGMADAVVLNDPIAGQGSNNASKCAKVYLDSINKHGSNEFDQAWMEKTFDEFWGAAYWSTKWSNTLLAPPSNNVVSLLKTAEQDQGVADYLANAFNNPASLVPWLESDESTIELVEKIKITNRCEEIIYEPETA